MEAGLILLPIFPIKPPSCLAYLLSSAPKVNMPIPASIATVFQLIFSPRSTWSIMLLNAPSAPAIPILRANAVPTAAPGPKIAPLTAPMKLSFSPVNA
ncbi:hypothetical protein D1872_218190 [compost metagenome]